LEIILENNFISTKKKIKIFSSRVRNKFIRIQNTTKFDKLLLKVQKSNNILEAKKLINMFPSEPRAHLLMANIMFNNRDENFISQLELYNKVNNEYLIKKNLDQLNIEFLKPDIFIGALGVYLHAWFLKNAIAAGLKKKKSFYCLIGDFKHTNKKFSEYFEKDFINFIYKHNEITKFLKIQKDLTYPVSFCLPLKNSCPFLPYSFNHILKELKNKNKKLSYFSLSSTDNLKGKRILKKLGIPENAWYVTCHIREPGWSGETQENSQQMIRNSDPETYLEAFKFIVSKGGYVIRMGHNSLKKINNLQNVIDLTSRTKKSEFLDVFLGASSKFSIVTSSGYSAIPISFGVPILHVNQMPTSAIFQCRDKDLYMPKILKKNNKILSLEETFIHKHTVIVDDIATQEKGIEFINNSSKEILEATKDMYELIFANKSVEIENKYLKNKITNNFKKLNLECLTNFPPSFLNKYN